MGLLAAFITAEMVAGYRARKASGGRLPSPGELGLIAIVFAALAITADAAPRARPVITATAWGLNVAGLLKVIPSSLGTAQATVLAEQGATAPKGGQPA